MRIKKHWLLILILLLAAVFRLWKLSSIPPHLTPDEASLGYNAYSILKTGKDEYGKTLPIIFKSFGDYKPGFYVYLTTPFIAVFGLNEFSVRLASAFMGVLAVLLIYLIVEKLFKDKTLSIISSFLMAILPWHIHFSRGAWEVNVSLTLTLAGIYFFLKAIKENKFLILSALFFSLTLITYQGAKLSTGIVLLILTILYWKDILKIAKSNGKVFFASLILGLIVSLPIVFSLFQGKAGRLEVFSVFSYPRPKEYLEAFLVQGGEKIRDFSYYLFHSETVNFKRGILGRWFNHFSTRFLFFEGDWANPRHSAPYHGMLIFSDLVLLISGFIILVRLNKKESFFVFLWLILAPLPAALSRDQIHAVRSLNMLVPLVIISSFGAKEIIFSLKRVKGLKKTIISIFILFYFANYTYFLDSYFVHLPIHDSKFWEYGYKQIVETVTPIQENYEKIKVQQSFAQPYIYFLFYQKYDPAKYQKTAKLVASEYKGDVGYVERLDNIEFAPIDWSVNRGESGTLFVADPIRIPPEDSADETLFSLIKEIKYLNNLETAFRILEVK